MKVMRTATLGLMLLTLSCRGHNDKPINLPVINQPGVLDNDGSATPPLTPKSIEVPFFFAMEFDPATGTLALKVTDPAQLRGPLRELYSSDAEVTATLNAIQDEIEKTNNLLDSGKEIRNLMPVDNRELEPIPTPIDPQSVLTFNQKMGLPIIINSRSDSFVHVLEDQDGIPIIEFRRCNFNGTIQDVVFYPTDEGVGAIVLIPIDATILIDTDEAVHRIDTSSSDNEPVQPQANDDAYLAKL